MSRRYCRCGHPLQNRQSAKHLFLDDLEGSPTQGQKVIACPGCGQVLLWRVDVTKEPPDEHEMSAMPDAEVMLKRGGGLP